MNLLTKFSEGVNRIRKFLRGVRKIYKISEGVFLAQGLVNGYFYGGAQKKFLVETEILPVDLSGGLEVMKIKEKKNYNDDNR